MWLIPIIILGLVYFYSYSEKLSGHQFWERIVDTESIIDRLYYYEIGYKTFINNLFIGGSTKTLADALPNASSHIVYLSLLAKYGIFGFTIYSFFIFYPIFYVIKLGDKLKKKIRYLILSIYLPLIFMYLGYDFFQFLEFQYLCFGIIYSIILNKIGIYKIHYRSKNFSQFTRSAILMK